jgi:molecular chaperone GrpE (heat shock protein)
MNLLETNYSDLLKAMGYVRIESKGHRFDPERMVAVEVERNSSVPDNTVIEELSCGYIFEEKVIKFAEVKVARNP